MPIGAGVDMLCSGLGEHIVALNNTSGLLCENDVFLYKIKRAYVFN